MNPFAGTLTTVLLQMTVEGLQPLRAARPLEVALAGCLWIAAKMGECRRGLPTASKVAILKLLHARLCIGRQVTLTASLSWSFVLASNRL